jgi:hypothetical protein
MFTGILPRWFVRTENILHFGGLDWTFSILQKTDRNISNRMYKSLANSEYEWIKGMQLVACHYDSR